MIDIELGQIWRAKECYVKHDYDWKVTYIVDDVGQTCTLKCIQDPRQQKRSNRYQLNQYSKLVGEVEPPIKQLNDLRQKVLRGEEPDPKEYLDVLTYQGVPIIWDKPKRAEPVDPWEQHLVKRHRVTQHRRLVDEAAQYLRIHSDPPLYVAFPTWTDGKEW